MVDRSDMGESDEKLMPLMLEYETVRGAEARAQLSALRLKHMRRLEIIQKIEEKQNNDLVELRRCIEYINQHTDVIQSALRNVDDSDAAVPVCSTIVKDIVAVKTNIQKCIENSVEIKKMLGVNYEHLMESLLKKMDTQLNNWTVVLDVASTTLLNSRALVDNIQNLIVTQQQVCSEVVESELFAHLNSTPIQGFSENIEPIDGSQVFCSTPAGN